MKMRARKRRLCRTLESRSISGVSDMKSVRSGLIRPGMSWQSTPISLDRQVPALAADPDPRRPDMTKFTAHTIETALIRSRPLLEFVKQALGFVPNLYSVFAE